MGILLVFTVALLVWFITWAVMTQAHSLQREIDRIDDWDAWQESLETWQAEEE